MNITRCYVSRDFFMTFYGERYLQEILQTMTGLGLLKTPALECPEQTDTTNFNTFTLYHIVLKPIV